MDVRLSLKSWRVEQDESKQPKLAGEYSVMLGDKEIASQNFNHSYSSKNVAFSGELMAQTKELELKIRAELERMLS